MTNKSIQATAAFCAFVSGAAIVSGRLLEGAPLLPSVRGEAGRVLAIIPARNEERNIRRSAGSILTAAEYYGDASVLVVDDGSTDATSAILRELQESHSAGKRLHVLSLAEALPRGWMGKPRACWAAAQSDLAKEAEWLLFLDADTDASPDLISRLVANAEANGVDLHSLFPHQELLSVAERLIMPHLFYALGVGFPWKRVNDPSSTLAIANGQCMLFRRTAYEAVGGHQAVRDSIAEDKALAEQIKGAGYRLYLADGRDVLTTRMYTTLPEIWEGWTKNAYLGLGDRAWLLLVAVFFGLAGGVLPFVALPLAARRRRWPEAFLWLLTIAVLLQNRDRAMREFEVPRWYAPTLPIGALLCCGIAFSAWYKVVSGRGVTWKGRRYVSSGERSTG